MPAWICLIICVCCCFVLLRLPCFRHLCFFVIGACYCCFRLALVDIPAAGTVDISGVVVGLPQVRSERTVFLFSSDLGKLRLSWYGSAPVLVPGDRYNLVVKIRPVRSSRNAGGFDYEGWLRRAGVVATGYVRSGSKFGSSWNVAAVRYAVGSVFPSGDGVVSLLRALGIGDRSLMSAAQRDVLARTGTAHLLAISGLHIGMVAGLFGFIARAVWRLCPSEVFSAPRCSMVCGLVFAFFYSLLAGFTLPTQRALLMLLFFAGALWLGRNVPWSVLLSRAMICVLLFDPLAPAAADFWLSFGAVALIAFVLSCRVSALEPADTLSRVVTFICSRRWLATQFAVAVGMMPLLVLWFGQYSLVSMPANLVAIPVVSLLVLPLVIAAVLLFFAPAIATVPLVLAEHMLELLWRFLVWLAELPWAVITLPDPSLLSLVLCLFGVFVLLLPAGVLPRIAGVGCLLALFLPVADDIDHGAVRVVMLDVGQGSATVILTKTHTLVFDTGAARAGGWSAARSVVVPFLRHAGRRNIDMLVLSHGDNDHAGGVADMVRLMPVARIVAGGGLAGFSNCLRGMEWEWDGVSFSFLHPPVASWEGNDGSCVLRVAAAGRVVLLPGDIEARAEYELVSSGIDLRADILFVPHHGSRTSSEPRFLQAVQPGYALVSAGCSNRFGFPKKDIMARYRSLGAVMLSTATEGMVEVDISRDGAITHNTWRQREWRAWHSWRCDS